MRRKLAGAVAAGAVGLALALCAPPLFTIARYQEAAERGETDVLARLTDFAAVRASVRGQTAARLLMELRRDEELVESPLGGFGLALAPSLADARARTLASPRAIAVLIVTGDPPRTAVEAAYPPGLSERGPVIRRVEIRGWQEVRLTLRPRSEALERATALVFRPRSLVRWRMVSIELPPGG
jgi:hypothetical protein